MRRERGPLGPTAVERTLEAFGSKWGFLVLRESFFGVRRFDEFQRNLGISRAVLTERLKDLVAEGILGRHRYQTRPDRYEYTLTDKGLALYPIFLAMMSWGDKWTDSEDATPALKLTHARCGKRTTPLTVCSECGVPLEPREMGYVPARSRRRATSGIEK